MTPANRSRVDVLPVATHELAWLEPEWRALERSAAASPYLSWDWLAAWCQVYQPRELRLVRVWDGDAIVALGLVEPWPGRRWRFAGAPVTPVRGLLSAGGTRQAAAWVALTERLGSEPAGCWMLEAEGLPADVSHGLGSAIRAGEPVYGLELPDSFEEYLAKRRPKTRKGLKQKLRRLDREGGRVSPVAPAERASALEDFLALHGARARAKGERHPNIDRRLTTLLAELADSQTLGLRLFELVVDGRRAGVTVRVDLDSTAHLYNAGMDPAVGRMSPGLLLELASIRDAIERGSTWFDLGPGAFRYKADLGGAPTPRYDLVWAAPSPVGHAFKALVGAGSAARAKVRRRPIMSRVHRWRPA